MKRLMMAEAALMLLTLTFFVMGCTPENDPVNNGGSNGNNPENGLPILTTSQVSNINSTTVTGGGVITSDGDSAITERGLCWGTQPNPDVSGTHATAGTGIGTFTCEITDLLPNTTYHVRAYAINGVGVGYGSDISFTTFEHGYVDLGLPSGTLWATCNVGAATPEGYGDYFAWGETQPKTTYNWSTYKYCNGDWGNNFDIGTLTKYCSDPNYGNNGFTDNLSLLQQSDDVANMIWGNEWRMPTKAECEELIQYTSHSWTILNGVKCMLFTGPNGKELFLPTSGLFNDDELTWVEKAGGFWSKSLCVEWPMASYGIVIGGKDQDNVGMDDISRDMGLSVRPVRSAE